MIARVRRKRQAFLDWSYPEFRGEQGEERLDVIQGDERNETGTEKCQVGLVVRGCADPDRITQQH